MDPMMNLNGMGYGTESNNASNETETLDFEQKSDFEMHVEEKMEQPVQIQNVEIKSSDNSTEEVKSLEEATTNYEKEAAVFSNIDFGPLKKYLDDDNITDISYSNGGQLWLKSLDKGVYRSDEQGVNDALIEKIAFQCSNVLG